MTRHSKNNTSSGAFSYAERQKLSQYGTQAVRCTAENLRLPTHCHFCLQEVKEGNCCSQGHLGCRECYLQDILAQKEAFKRAQTEAAAEIAKQKQEEAKKVEAEKDAKVKDFLAQQQPGSKRIKLAAEDPKTDSKTLLLKSSTVSVPTSTTASKAEICCRGGGKDSKHPLSLKSLIPVQMPQNGACPSCERPLKSSVKFLVVKACGHVACHACHQKIKPKLCFTCSAEVKETLTVTGEGTGFAAGGGTTDTSRYDLGFQ